MSKFEKLIRSFYTLDKGIRFDEIRKVLEHYGYQMRGPSGGSSHKTFRKPGEPPVTIPNHTPVKKAYVELVREIIEKEEKDEQEDR